MTTNLPTENDGHATHQSHHGVPSPFALSFERITIESLASSWQELEGLVHQLAEKRALVEQHTKLAADHIRAVSMVNTEIDSLEKKFSSVLAGMVAERTRVQDKLRALVLEWEKTSAHHFAERSKELQKSYDAEHRKTREQLESLLRERETREHQLHLLQQRNKDMELVLTEYGLSTTGPLVESLKARALLAQQGPGISAGALTAPSSSGGGGGSPQQLQRGSIDASGVQQIVTQQQHTSSSSTLHRLSSSVHQHLVPAAEREMVAESERLRLEVMKLQADLAASKAESRMRLDEVKALRAVREESTTTTTRGDSVSQAAFYQLSGAKSIASTSNVSATPMSQSRTLFEEHGRLAAAADDARRASAYTASATMYPQQQTAAQQPSRVLPQKIISHMSLGLDLGTRRQQKGLRGVHVTDVVEGSPAYNAGIRRHDVILSVAGRQTGRLEEVAAAISSVRPHSQLVIEYARLASMTAPIEAGESHRAVILVDGQLDGPHNTRREHFRSP